MHTAKLAASLPVMFALALSAAPARAETINCTPINAVPAVITLPGVYCLTKSFATSLTSGSLIDIEANNVVLDLNGFRLGGLAAGFGTSAVGIYASNRQNITIRNGTIRGFLIAISLQNPSGGSQGHLVEDIRADQNTWVGIWVKGSGSIVRNNQVVATGGSTAFGVDVDVFGIFVSGDGARVLNNDVIATVGPGTGLGYAIYFSANSGGTGGLAVNNRITNADSGIDILGTGKYRDNLTFAVVAPFTGGTDAGNNN